MLSACFFAMKDDVAALKVGEDGSLQQETSSCTKPLGLS
jgi:hypothetical protein